jgi:methyltransferase (TIGR00027 family)
MKEGRPSQTASLVALFRAFADAGLAHVTGFHDPTARKMLPPAWAKRFARTEERARRGVRSSMVEAVRYGADNIALRTWVIDAHLRDAIERGARQLVLLGAGLDGRAYRLKELLGVRVFEVDHPATQAFKKQCSAELTSTAASVTFVTVNFERDKLEPRLVEAGLRTGEPTIWIWEGVVMYLTQAAMRATLRDIASMSAAGSTLIVNYHAKKRSLLTNLFLRLWSEPQIGAWTPGAMAREIGAVGLRVIADTGTADWATRFQVPAKHMHDRGSPRVLAAVR